MDDSAILPKDTVANILDSLLAGNKSVSVGYRWDPSPSFIRFEPFTRFKDQVVEDGDQTFWDVYYEPTGGPDF